MFDRFDASARRVVITAQVEARRLGHTYIGTEHLLLGMLASDDPMSQQIFAFVGVTFDSVYEQVKNVTPVVLVAEDSSAPMFTNRAKAIIELALRESMQLGHDVIGVVHLLLGMLRDSQSTATQLLIEFYQVDVTALRRLLIDMATSPQSEPRQPAPALVGREAPPSAQNSSMLDQYGTNLSALAKAGSLDPVAGRTEEIDRVIQILSRRSKNNPILVGDPGVGKTAIVEGLALRMTRGVVIEPLRDKQIYTIDLAQLVAGARYRGDFEERFKRLLREVTSRTDVILFLDEIHTLVGAGAAEGSIDASSMLKPLLARGSLQTIGATTLDEYRIHFEKDAALARRFQRVLVSPPSVSDTVDILKALRPSYESHHHVVFTDAALKAASSLSDRYISDRLLPDKAVDLMDEAGSRLRLRESPQAPQLLGYMTQLNELYAQLSKDQNNGGALDEGLIVQRILDVRQQIERLVSNSSVALKGVVTPEIVSEVISAWTKIPLTRIVSHEASRLLNVEADLATRIIGQTGAIETLSRAIRRQRAGLRRQGRPAGSFMFIGPSGVGKTALAKALADVVLGDPSAITLIDMSEYMEKHSVSRLIGSPPGYVGYDDPGQLTEAIRRRPFSVILFDEIEKAHPDVFNVLLQVLDEARLTDARGRVVDFSNTFIIMTSNLATKEMSRQPAGFLSPGAAPGIFRQEKIDAALKEHFRPEFLNRLDEIIVFNELTHYDLLKIVDLLIEPLVEDMAALGVNLSVSAPVKEFLVSECADASLGARPLRRSVERLLGDPLSHMLISSPMAPGTSLEAQLTPRSTISFVTPIRELASIIDASLSNT